jgi:hypothetical protein
VFVAETMMSPAQRGLRELLLKDCVVHSSHDANCSSRTDNDDQKMKLVAQWVIPLALKIISTAQRIKLVDWLRYQR